MAETSRNTIERKPFYRRLIRILLYTLLSLAILLIVTTGFIYFYKDQIAEKILLVANDNQNGEIRFSDISFNPFVQFPSVSIQLNDFSYFEQFKDSLNNNFRAGVDSLSTLRMPIAEFQYLYAAVDILDLIKGNIDISKVMLKNGAINVIKYPDSTFNFSNAITPTIKDTSDITPINEEEIMSDSKGSDQEVDDMNFLLDKVSFRNIQITYFDSIEFDHKMIIIDKLNASLEYMADVITSGVDVQLQLVEFGITSKIKIRDKTVKLTSSINFDRKNNVLDIIPSTLNFEDAIFNFFGNIDFKGKGYINLEIEGSDQDFGFSKLLLTETGIDQIKHGDLYFDGTVKGDLTEGIPNFNFSFGLKDVDLHIPSVNNDIADINLDGLFISGILEDLSNAKLSVKNLTAKLPGGYLKGSCEIENFVTPDLKLDWDMKANLSGFEDIFKLEFIDNLGGNITINDHMVAHFDRDLKCILEDDSYSFINCDHLTFNIPGVLFVNDFSGNFHGGRDTLLLDSVSLLTGNTDLLINGEFYNLMSLILNNDRSITANLEIKSDVFDLPELFAYDPRVGRNFPHQIVDIDLLVGASTTTSKLLDFYSNPEIDFEIQHLDATIQDFLPPVSISEGLFKLHEKEERLLLNFYDFDIEMMGSEIKADVEYHSPRVLPDYVKTKVNLENLSPGKVFYYGSSDTIPNFLNGFINGSLICDVTLATDTNTLDKIFIDQGNLEYETAKDTFRIKSLYLDAENIIYNLDVKSNPLATLTSKCIIKAQEVNMGILEVKDVRYDLDINTGEYFITPKKISFFGEEGQGTYVLKPYIETPTYELEYSVEQFQVEKLLTSFLEDTIITGIADFSMNISMSGDHWDSVIGNINGDLYLSGTELTMYGLDADKLIEKLKRSQNFNLVDVGAVILAGPVGLAVTKGSDFARIIVANPGEQTFIPNFSSAWKVKNGRLIIEDVAFSTDNNRIAAHGWIDLKMDSLSLTIAALDKNGCSIISQDLYGKFENPEMSDVKVVKSVLAPVTNLVKGAVGIECIVFYEGKVKHPEKRKSNN